MRLIPVLCPSTQQGRARALTLGFGLAGAVVTPPVVTPSGGGARRRGKQKEFAPRFWGRDTAKAFSCRSRGGGAMAGGSAMSRIRIAPSRFRSNGAGGGRVSGSASARFFDRYSAIRAEEDELLAAGAL